MAGATEGGLTIRSARLEDSAQIAMIYAHHVRHGTATFDTEPPPADHWGGKIESVQAHGWPFLVAEAQGALFAFAYAAQFRDRPAFCHCCEDSIYVRIDRLGHGIGTALLAALIEAARASGFTQMLAIIGDAEPASVALHTRLGFRHAGRMDNVGYKFGRWLDIVCMQRTLVAPDKEDPHESDHLA